MTDKIKECKYKIQQDNYKKGKAYCAISEKSCSELSFVCDKNCEVFEDQKQLLTLQQENKELKDRLDIVYASLNISNEHTFESLKFVLDDYRRSDDEFSTLCNDNGILTKELYLCKEDEKLYKQLINWILNKFNITKYDMLADQNEISTEIEMYIDELKEKLEIAEKALHKIHSFEYDNYGMYDDDYEEQIEWILQIACKALQALEQLKKGRE